MIDPLQVERRGKPIDLEGLWNPNPAFLVGGGPSLNDLPLERLKDRGVVSLAINQSAAWVPVKAWVFSDTQWKFHSSLFMDPAVMTFAPIPKLRRQFHLKTEEGFHDTGIRLNQCPNTYGYSRLTCFVPDEFFTTTHAHWGPRKHQPADKPEQGCLCTMLLGIRLLHYLGVRRIYLLGVDNKGRDGKCYAFPEGKGARTRRYKWERHMLERLQPQFDKRGMELYNCSPDSDCRLYPFRSFDEALKDCKGSVEDDPLDTTGWYDMSSQQEQCRKNPKIVPVHYGGAR